jgi:hypothetical protein
MFVTARVVMVHGTPLAANCALLPSDAKLAFSPKTPVNATAIKHDSGDVPADVLVEHRLPGHKAEPQSVVNHGETAAGVSPSASVPSFLRQSTPSILRSGRRGLPARAKSCAWWSMHSYVLDSPRGFGPGGRQQFGIGNGGAAHASLAGLTASRPLAAGKISRSPQSSDPPDTHLRQRTDRQQSLVVQLFLPHALIMPSRPRSPSPRWRRSGAWP